MNVGIDTLRAMKGLDPVANAFAGTVRSDVVNMSLHSKVMFLVYKGAGASGTSTITVQACDDNSPSTESPVEFQYSRASNSDAPTALTKATTAGFTTTAGASDLYFIQVNSQALASSGYKYVCLKMVEVVASAVLGGIVILTVPKYAPSRDTITS